MNETCIYQDDDYYIIKATSENVPDYYSKMIDIANHYIKKYELDIKPDYQRYVLKYSNNDTCISLLMPTDDSTLADMILLNNKQISVYRFFILMAIEVFIYEILKHHDGNKNHLSGAIKSLYEISSKIEDFFENIIYNDPLNDITVLLNKSDEENDARHAANCEYLRNVINEHNLNISSDFYNCTVFYNEQGFQVSVAVEDFDEQIEFKGEKISKLAFFVKMELERCEIALEPDDELLILKQATYERLTKKYLLN